MSWLFSCSGALSCIIALAAAFLVVVSCSYFRSSTRRWSSSSSSLLITKVQSLRRHRFASNSSGRAGYSCPRPGMTHLLIVLGSGGHTAEMLMMLESAALDTTVYTRRTYLVSSGDTLSAQKARAFENALLKAGTDAPKTSSSPDPSYTIATIPRSRKVHQSLLTAPFSTLRCVWSCFLVLFNRHPDQKAMWPSGTGGPDLVLTNGPGNAVCIIMAAKILRYLYTLISPFPRPGDGSRYFRRSEYPRLIFIESWARVKTLSLSGKLVLPFADRFIVQWRDLGGYSSWLGGKAEYMSDLLF